MIAERALAEHIQTLHAGLTVFKDELAWHQAGEPWPYLMVTKIGEVLQTTGAGDYDTDDWESGPAEFSRKKLLRWRKRLRLTIRSTALSGKSGVTVVEEVAQAIKGLAAQLVTGKSLDLTDSVSSQSVHLSRLRLMDESDQSPQLSRVPFEAQRTLDLEIQVATLREVSREKAFDSAEIILTE